MDCSFDRVPLLASVFTVLALCSPTFADQGIHAKLSIEMDDVSDPSNGRFLSFGIRSDNQAVLAHVDVQIDGKSFILLWDEIFDDLFDFLDRNGNGVLDATEITLAPSPFSIRQILWGNFVAGTRLPSSTVAKEFKSGAISRKDLANFYRRHSIGTGVVGWGRSPWDTTITSIMARHLDGNEDGNISEPEIRAARMLLKRFDFSGDEMLDVLELMPTRQSSVTPGATFIRPLNVEGNQPTDLRWMVLVRLLRRPKSSELGQGSALGGDGRDWPAAAANHVVSTPIRFKSDADSGMHAVEKEDRSDSGPGNRGEADLSMVSDAALAMAIHALEPNRVFHWRVNLGRRSAGQRVLQRTAAPGRGEKVEQTGMPRLGDVQIHLRAADGMLVEMARGARERLHADFKTADRDGNETIDDRELAEKVSLGQLQELLTISDRNGNGLLEKGELGTWLDLQARMARAHVLLSLIDGGYSLFDMLDVDRDDRLSARELEGAHAVLKEHNCFSAMGILSRENLPRYVVGTVSIGHPTAPLNDLHHDSPSWFEGMDRNRDGEVSFREYVGTLDRFLQLDRNGNQRIEREEASTAYPHSGSN
ncbi:MAG: hypothetical protein U1D30_13665 [Planctomycetota bacterium]